MKSLALKGDNMDNNTLLEVIRDKNIDVQDFANRVIADEVLRDEIVKELLTNKDIMVYYHCYYIVSRASEIRADLFYKYWDDFVVLLDHKNSYHRDIGLTVIANLVSVDEKHCFDHIFEDYLSHIDDEKFMTAQCFVKNLRKVVENREDLRVKVIGTLLEIDKKSSYPVKQRELLKYDILEIFDMIYIESDLKERINYFIINALDSISPKTRKKAKELREKYL